MAGIAKIVSKTLDDIAKVASKVVIGLGDAVIGDVKDPKTFYAGSTTLKTGTMPTKAIVAASDLYEEGYHAGNPGGLDAIDTDLAPANIKSGVNIFGKVGTLVAGTLAEDVEGDAVDATVTNTGSVGWYKGENIGATSELVLATKNLTFDAASLAFAAGFACLCGWSTYNTLRLYMGGVLMQTSAILDNAHSLNVVLRDFKVLSGSQDCELRIYNSDTSVHAFYGCGRSNASERPGAVAVGSVKLV